MMYTVRIWIESFITWLQMLKRNESTILSGVKFGKMLVPIVVRKVRFAFMYIYFQFVHLFIHGRVSEATGIRLSQCLLLV